MEDVLIVGAGPAGSVAAAVLARAGVRVRIVDRATFPREKLCGDTVNPGTLARLRRLRLADAIDEQGVPLDGMVVTGEGGVAIEARYPNGLCGRSLSRATLDWELLQQAVAAGAQFEPGVAVRHAVVAETPRGPRVEGVAMRSGSLGARVTIAADGRRSTLAFGLKLAHHPPRPRRWAVGAYFEGTRGTSSFGEMHIRRGRYVGVAPIPEGLTNVCLVFEPVGPTSRSGAYGDRTGAFCDPAGLDLVGPTFRSGAYGGRRGAFRDPEALLRGTLEGDERLRDRFAGARLVAPPAVLGPLAVDVIDGTIDGLILAGDAAGFIDPMTGDGLQFAVRGGELAAAAAFDALQHGWNGVHARLAAARRREFLAKWRFNRLLRTLVASPTAMRAAAMGARLSPAVVRVLVARAGDCDLAGRVPEAL